MFIQIFIAFLVTVYLLCCAEIIGSWVLTAKKQDNRWPLSFSILPMLIPIMAPVAAYDSIYYARELYEKHARNEHHFQESLYEYLRHGCLSIDEWADKNSSAKH